MREQKLPHGHRVIGFSSMEEMNEYMENQEREANESILEPQRVIGWGSYVFRLVEDLAIWGYIFSENKFVIEEMLAEGSATKEELEAELVDLRDSHARGYRYGMWYSVVEPTGEYGSAHISALWPITKEDFEIGRANNWELVPVIANRIADEIITAVNTMKERKK